MAHQEQEHQHRPSRAGQPHIPTSEEMRTWALDNPLWRWRRERHLSRAMAAGMVGVGSTSVWHWEHGGASPAPERWEKLVEVIGPEVVEHWAEWLAKRPSWSQWDGGRVVEADAAATAEMGAAADALFQRAVAEEGVADGVAEGDADAAGDAAGDGPGDGAAG